MIEAVSADAFLAWAVGVGIGFDPQYPGTGCLTLLPPREASRSWFVPDSPYGIPHFIGTMLRALDQWEFAYLWPRDGRWPAAGETHLPNEQVRDVVWRGAGLPSGWAGAARIGREEWPELVSALFAAVALGGDSCSDLFLVPDHGRQIVHAGHHDAIHIACADDLRLAEVVRSMEQAGYRLPIGTSDSE